MVKHHEKPSFGVIFFRPPEANVRYPFGKDHISPYQPSTFESMRGYLQWPNRSTPKLPELGANLADVFLQFKTDLECGVKPLDVDLKHPAAAATSAFNMSTSCYVEKLGFLCLRCRGADCSLKTDEMKINWIYPPCRMLRILKQSFIRHDWILGRRSKKNQRIKITIQGIYGRNNISATSSDPGQNIATSQVVAEVPGNPLVSQKSRVVKFYNFAR